MRSLLIAITQAVALSTVLAIPARAAAPADTGVLAVARQWADAFGLRSFETDSAPCAEDAVVIDDLPPHVWQGPGACSAWFRAFEAWAAQAGATDAAITLGEISHLDVDGDFAYLVAPVTLSYRRAGKSVEFPGTITLTLRKRTSGWGISGAAWADR